MKSVLSFFNEKFHPEDSAANFLFDIEFVWGIVFLSYSKINSRKLKRVSCRCVLYM